jgi:hypothetical protein
VNKAGRVVVLAHHREQPRAAQCVFGCLRRFLGLRRGGDLAPKRKVFPVQIERDAKVADVSVLFSNAHGDALARRVRRHPLRAARRHLPARPVLQAAVVVDVGIVPGCRPVRARLGLEQIDVRPRCWRRQQSDADQRQRNPPQTRPSRLHGAEPIVSTTRTRSESVAGVGEGQASLP